MGLRQPFAFLSNFIWFLVWLGLFAYAGYHAFEIRLYAIRTYGLVIHEFDPWFNFRATQYLADNGWTKFFRWFDYKVWYPLGRPVGTTIYPGMQISSVCIWRTLNAVYKLVKPYKIKALRVLRISLNDVCCYVPAWFGVSATIFLGLLTAEASGSWASGVAASGIMSIIPAHIMRSVGGGYDNESIAVTALCMTFFFWCRALRADPKVTNCEATRDSYVYGTMTGFAFVYMAAAWGGFTFVLNLIAVHTVALVAMGRYSSRLHRAYTLFYVVGIFGATRVPVIGYAPFKSMEQLSALLVFYCIQFLELVEIQRRKRNLNMKQVFVLRVKVFIPALAVVVAAAAFGFSIGYFAPLGARIRGLFVKHTRTGNPLVDSVAEHQPASEAAYRQYLNKVYDMIPYGLGISIVKLIVHWSDANAFILIYSGVAYYFCTKMSRLILLLGPVASALGGYAIGFIVDHCLVTAIHYWCTCLDHIFFGDSKNAEDSKAAKVKKAKKKDSNEAANDAASDTGSVTMLKSCYVVGLRVWRNPLVIIARISVAAWAFREATPAAKEFYEFSHQMAEGMSNPSIMFKARLNDGREVMVDDYREAYWWLRDNTAEDARVMAWWDYGYQITGIGNRTTIADGNTWNHEHIATLGRILSGSETRSHNIARHLADYVLVWAGGGGDDLAKSPHMARIGNSVYHDICPGDPTCQQFGFYHGGIPTPMMANSLLYKLTQFGYRKDINLDPSRYTHVFTSKFGKVRIFKIMGVSAKSKNWVADPANRVCDAPGSWYCSGQYPPALKKLIDKRKAFRQLEDFNKDEDEDSKKYTEEYLKRMAGGDTGDKKRNSKSKSEASQAPKLSGPPPKYVGCYGAERQLGADVTYGGGVTGSSIDQARHFAWNLNKKYVALARVGSDGHSFAFDAAPTGPKLSDDGCRNPCMDYDSYDCGCADASCGNVKIAKGEEHLRRWVVYDVGTAPDRKKPKKKRKSASEL